MRTLSLDTRQRIFDAAARLFAVQRFHEVRMEDIAVEAGVGKGTVYRYFSDKEDLYGALIVTASKQLLREVEERLTRVENVQAKLEELVAALVGFFDSQPYFFDLVQHVEALRAPGRKLPWAKTRKEFLARVRDLLQQGQTDGSFTVRDPSLSALMLLGAIRAVIRFGERPRPRGLARQIVERFLFGAHEFRSDRQPRLLLRRPRAVKAPRPRRTGT